MFGGIGPTIKALGTYVVGLITPVTAVAAAVAALAYASYDASSAVEKLSIASAKGFGTAGSAEYLNNLVNSLNALQGIRLGPAEEAVARLAASGKLTGDNFALAAEASARWSSVTGEGADDIAAKFEAIARDPLQAMEDGVLRVTQAQYDQIRALIEQGDKQGAVNIATKLFYDTVNDNSAKVEQHLTGVSRLLSGIKDEFGEATRGVGGFLNGISDYFVRVTEAGRQLRKDGAGFFGSRIGMFSASAQGWTNTPAQTSSSAAATLDPNIVKALTEFQKDADKTHLAALSVAKRRQEEINKIIADGAKANLKADSDLVKQRIADQKKVWATQDAKKANSGAGALANAAMAAGLATYKNQLKEEKAALEASTKDLQQQYSSKLISAEDYYKQLNALSRTGTDDEVKSIQQQIAFLQRQTTTRKNATQVAKQIADLEAELSKVRIEGAASQKTLSDKETQAVKDRENAIAAYKAAIDDSSEAMRRQFAAATLQVSMGDKQYEIQSKLADAYEQQSKRLRELALQAQQDPGNKAKYDAETQVVRDAYAE